MYTVKIKWIRYEDGERADESTLFIPADQVVVHGEITDESKQMKAWEPGSFFDYKIVSHEDHKPHWTSRIIEVTLDGKQTWYLASLAWLMGPTGQTIEKLTA